ncbi:MAG: PP2C family protein-serine/threonine phosphatase [Gemmatimonadota bacterium]
MGRARARNEDAILQRPGRGILAVADGMGGHAAGDIASRIAVDIVDDRTAHLPEAGAGAYLRDTVRAAHDAILRAAEADPELRGMGTTLTILYVDPEHRATIAHVGDSRAYRLRDGTLEQLTTDQTWVQEQVNAGLLSPEQARGHPFSAMLTCALGIEETELEVQILEHETEPDDLFLLCSDGLTARLHDDDLRLLLLEHSEPHHAARALVDAANEAGGPDNITVGLVRILGEGQEDGPGQGDGREQG